jgi:ATP-binding cassette subfamily C protein CydC
MTEGRTSEVPGYGYGAADTAHSPLGMEDLDLLKDAPLLVLDEPTANLDTVTERELLASAWEAARDRAVLLITHRLVGMEEVDEILVLDAGRVVERGTHEQLRTGGGLYSRMLGTQQELLVEPRAS